jgi:hypothetical protein
VLQAVTNSRLNDLLIDLGRSLLQYAGEAWPWTAAFDSGAARQVIEQLGAEQRKSVEQIAKLLQERHHTVDFGVYPDEYTSLHYVSQRYMLDQLIVNERSLVEECDALARECRQDPEAASLIESIREREQRALSELRKLHGG